LAAGIVQGVNQLHRAGYAADGITNAASASPHPPLAFNNYFFVGDPANANNPGLPAGVDYTGNYKGMVSSLALDPNIVLDSSLIAAAGVAGAKGDNANALAMAALQTATGTVDLDGNGVGDSGASYSNVVGNLVSDVGNKVQLYATQTTAQQNLLTALQNQRDAISGVNLDEEASAMMTLQRGYQASARFISVINQLTDQLVNQFGR
jgi:flagellar hook-associated protein 1 FlgK